MQLDLDVLGITRDDLIQRVVDKITETVMSQEMREDGASYFANSDLAETLQSHVKEQVDTKVAELAEKFVLPDVGTLIENFTLQKTNEWGEKVGAKVSFIEYLVQRADAYIKEPVDYDGKVIERGGYGKATQTRIAHMIDKHLHYSISQAMTKALADVTGNIAKGLEETVKIKLAEATASLKVSTTIK